ncbi:MAG: hypothetical protein Q4G69_04525 [Planctomycetia bacterium]|nr:hypothetical protein [Planctomycetia bacterium]
MQKFFFAFSFLAILSVISGCSGEKRPDGMPKLYPCRITILQEGKPLANATVDLVSKNGSFKWSIMGTTDANGLAELRTHSLYKGVPSGTFSVAVEKREPESDPKKLENLPPEQRNKPIKIFSYVDAKYTSSDTSPLEMTVEKSPVSKEFDLGKPVRKHVDTLGKI